MKGPFKRARFNEVNRRNVNDKIALRSFHAGISFAGAFFILAGRFMPHIYDLIAANCYEPASERYDIYIFSAMRALFLCH
jgi:hypothetical protein